MAAIEEGKTCMLTHGRRAGQKVTIAKVLDEGQFAVVKLKSGKERKVSIKHLDPKEK